MKIAPTVASIVGWRAALAAAAAAEVVDIVAFRGVGNGEGREGRVQLGQGSVYQPDEQGQKERAH